MLVDKEYISQIDILHDLCNQNETTFQAHKLFLSFALIFQI